MTGTIVNALAIVAGSVLGLLVKKGLPHRVEETVMKIMGLAVGVIGLNGIISSMFTVGEGGKLSSSGELLMLGSLVAGSIAGELLDLDGRLNRFGAYIESKTKTDGFSRGFVSASIIYCVGAMAIIGALNDGLTGDSRVLFIKSALDGITAVILTTTLGFGVLFSAVPVFVYQGAISLLAGAISPLVSQAPALLGNICCVGYVIVIAIGLNLMEVCKIRVANLLPALAVPILYQCAQALLH